MNDDDLDDDDGCGSSCRVNGGIWINLGGTRIKLFVVAGWRNPDTGRNDVCSANIVIARSIIIVTVSVTLFALLLASLAIILLIVDSISSLVCLPVTFIPTSIESHQPGMELL